MLGASRSGDVVVMPEGVHELAHTALIGIDLVGEGDPAKVVLRACIEARETTRMSNLTLEAPNYSNALQVTTPSGRAELHTVTVRAEPSGKYPGVWASDGAVLMSQTSVVSEYDARGVVIEKAAELHAWTSTLPCLRVEGGRASLHDVETQTIFAGSAARVDADGTLTVRLPDGKRSIVATAESVVTIEHLVSIASVHEALFEDSVLTLGAVTGEPSGAIEVIHSGFAKVTVPERGARTTERDADGNAVARPAKELVWHAGEPFDDLRPLLMTGDTVVLEAGEYDLGTLPLETHFRGAGAHATRVRASFSAAEGMNMTLSDLALQAPDGQNAFNIGQDVTITLTGVEIDAEETNAYPSVFLSAGVVTMTDCQVRGESVATGVCVTNGARLEATQSYVNDVHVESGARATLTGSGAGRLVALSGGEIVSDDAVVLKNAPHPMQAVCAESGGAIRVATLAVDDVDPVGVIASSGTIRVAEVVAGDDADVRIEADDESDVVFGGWEQTQVQVPGRTDEGEPGAGIPEPLPTAGAEDPLAEIDRLTGLSSVKAQIRSFVRKAKFNQLLKQQGRPVNDAAMHSMFLGNPGTGKTTVAKLLGEALFQAGAIQKPDVLRVGRRDLVSDNLGGSAKLTGGVLERARGGVLLIDEAYDLYQRNNNEFAEEAVTAILDFMDENRDEIMVVFAGYGDRMQDLLRMNPGLPSRVPNRFHFEDYTPDEVAEIGFRDIERDGYVVDEDLYRRAIASHYRQTNDGGNARWVRNVNENLISALADRVVDELERSPERAADIDTSVITDEEILAVTSSGSHDADAVEQILAELYALTGLQPVKDWVRDLMAQAQVDRDMRDLDPHIERPMYHMVFTGRPGTGKTTVAKLVARLFHALGLLPNATVKVTDRAKLIGEYIGSTEANVTKVLDEAMGGVLFIDEAYQLYRPDNPRDYGPLVLETLVPRLTDDKDRFVTILAGYTDAMDQLLTHANEGLPSRFPLRIEFPDYTPEEVATIVIARLGRTWEFDEDQMSRVVVEIYSALPADKRVNGRWAEHFAARVKTVQSRYLAAHRIRGEQMRVIPPDVIDSLVDAVT
ncbi:MAG: AAA family ATPase [Microbacterium gubbeenense]|uniref:AAA family ATPase n=1 Tax=Microbacterium gubbeenense TaxID=159896 RepID=UPI003F9DD578